RGKIHFSQRFRLFPEFYVGRDYQEPIFGLRVPNVSRIVALGTERTGCNVKVPDYLGAVAP
ncbi:MAG TPA: hypothetical protein VI386_33135, partial [Candidatus Sulfotelmatobacter sp.]